MDVAVRELLETLVDDLDTCCMHRDFSGLDVEGPDAVSGKQSLFQLKRASRRRINRVALFGRRRLANCGDGGGLHRFLAPPRQDRIDLIEIEIDDRRDVEGQHLRDAKAADYGDAERLA